MVPSISSGMLSATPEVGLVAKPGNTGTSPQCVNDVNPTNVGSEAPKSSALRPLFEGYITKKGVINVSTTAV